MEELVINEMKAVFRNDEKRIYHALKVLSFAKEINKSEEGYPLIVKASAIVHDIGIHEAENKLKKELANFIENIFKTKTGMEIAL